MNDGVEVDPISVVIDPISVVIGTDTGATDIIITTSF